MLEKLTKKLKYPYQLKTSMNRGVAQFLEMELETNFWKVIEDKIQESQRHDGYNAIITKNLTLSNEEVYEIYRWLWKIEESFRVIEMNLGERPVYIHNDEHIKGHFMSCFLALRMKRYAQPAD